MLKNLIKVIGYMLGGLPDARHTTAANKLILLEGRLPDHKNSQVAEIRPAPWDSSREKAAGDRSTSSGPHPGHESTIVASTVLP